MIIYYNKKYNIDFGPLNKLHPFDGLKFKKVYQQIKNLPNIQIQSPTKAISDQEIDEYIDVPLRKLRHQKSYIFQALELPPIPVLPFWLVDHIILKPMRWGVAGTLEASKQALEGNNCWNLAGGYHHASQGNAEGFCIYNDIGIAVQQLRKLKHLKEEDKILILDIDAHHGNGNTLAFRHDERVTTLDIYNTNVYPKDNSTKVLVDINLPIPSGTAGPEYLARLQEGLQQLTSGYKLAYVVAGTDVLYTDPLGGLGLTIDECVHRDAMVLERLSALSIPAIFLGGGGYSKESFVAISESIKQLYLKY